MQIKLHKNAKTTLAVRKIIKDSDESINYLTKKYGIGQTPPLNRKTLIALKTNHLVHAI